MKIEDLNNEELNNYNPDIDPDIIPWKRERQLKWEDFTGEPDVKNEAGALTKSIIYSKCDAKIVETTRGFKFQLVNISSVALFQKSGSWVKPIVLRSNQHAIILKHEQGHFDIKEVYARKLQRKLYEMGKTNYPCKGETLAERQKYADDEAEKVLNNLSKEMNREQRSLNEQYEDQTNHGINLRNQGRWNLTIEKLLRES